MYVVQKPNGWLHCSEYVYICLNLKHYTSKKMNPIANRLGNCKTHSDSLYFSVWLCDTTSLYSNKSSNDFWRQNHKIWLNAGDSRFLQQPQMKVVYSWAHTQQNVLTQTRGLVCWDHRIGWSRSFSWTPTSIYISFWEYILNHSSTFLARSFIRLNCFSHHYQCSLCWMCGWFNTI